MKLAAKVLKQVAESLLCEQAWQFTYSEPARGRMPFIDNVFEVLAF